MSQQQVAHFRLIKFLLTQLKGFGLNPSEWTIDRTSQVNQNTIFLVNKADQQFKFAGSLSLKNGLPAWQNLTLLSL